MSNSVFKGYKTFSNHGTNEGIVPRFYLQMVDMAKLTLDQDAIERLESYLNKNMSDFTELYDTFKEIKEIYVDYREGLLSGKYYSVDSNSAFKHDNSKELILKKKIKDFFISARLLVNNFAKSKIIDDGNFILNNFLIVKDANFEKNKTAYLQNPSEINYSPLIQLIEKARSEFLTPANQIRADFEHQNLQVEDFQIKSIDGKIEIIEPTFGHSNLLVEIEIIYERLLDLIEKLLAYYFGLSAYKNTNGFMMLFKKDEFDYSQMKYKYVIQPRIYESGQTPLIKE